MSKPPIELDGPYYSRRHRTKALAAWAAIALFALLCVLVFLPCLAVLCYKLIDKTQHRSFIPTFRGFSYFVMKVKVRSE